ncbi:BatA domain-containing protein [Pontibacter sp. MBLB2868]|uniref:BatA domain-containing protein n=1 Tax=Pontibacter sp. MBLB2868 TaxID=3451555 RepID=UPI003F754D75
MSFLYPSFLFALAAIAIPILLHLVQLRRAKKVVFSNVKFIQASKDLTASQRTLKQLLILLARVLFIIFLVLAFAQPFIPGSESAVAANESDVAIAVDNSFSAQNLQAGKDITVMNAAVDLAKTVIKLFPPSTAFAVTSSTRARHGASVQGADASAYLDELTFSSTAFPLLSQRKNPAHLFLLSDFQKSTFSSRFLDSYDSLTQIHLVPIASAGNANVAVDSVYLEDEFIRPGTDNILHVRVINTGTEAVDDVPVKLFIDNRQVAAISLDLSAKQATEAILSFRVGNEATTNAYVQLDDFPVDFDNTYYFVLTPSKGISITEITDQEQSPLEGLYKNEALFKFSKYRSGNINYAAATNSDVIILNAIDNLSAAIAKTAANFVKAGGTLVLIPPAKGDQSGYSSLFQELNISAAFSGVGQEGAKTSLEAPDPNNPFFRNIFSEFDAKMQMPTSIRGMVWSRASDDILKFKGGAPFLSRYDRGKGQFFLMAAPLQEQYNTLVNHALLLPIMYKVVISGYKQEQQLAYTLGNGVVQVPVSEVPAKEGIFKLEQDTLSFIPEQQVRGGRLYFTIPSALNQAGFYTLKLQDKDITTLAFNYNNEESQLEQYTPDELRTLVKGKKNVHVYDYGDAFSVKGEFEKRYFGVKLWKYCLILCLLFLMAEIALIRFL